MWGFKRTQENDLAVVAPASGEVIALSQVNDPVFSQGMMGLGCGLHTEDKILYAPISGEVVTLFPTLHAIGIRAENGLEILIHIGINTTELNGKGFTPFVKQGSMIRKGKKMIEVDFELIKENGYDPTTMMIITNSSDYPSIEVKTGSVEANETLMEVKL